MKEIDDVSGVTHSGFLNRWLSVIMWLLAGVGLVATVATIVVYRATFDGGFSQNHTDWSEFGSYIGGVLGPLFALLALIALLITLRLQVKELQISGQELQNSAAALAEQSSSLKLQNFESRFFNMLTLHHQIVNAMDLRAKEEGTQVVAKGRDCLRVFFRRLEKQLSFAARGDDVSYQDGIISAYDRFYKKYGHELGHYFRNVYRILKYIDESNANDKRDYSGILRAQLSNHELALLFYNGLAKHGVKLKPLAEKYALFENLEFGLLANQSRDVQFYESEAFGDRADSLASGGE